LAARLLGPTAGGTVALVGSLSTWSRWGHPWAIIIFTLEAVWVGRLARRAGGNVVVADFAFWLLLGAPLVALFYAGVLGLEGRDTLLIVLKQCSNGLFNALLASILATLTPVGRLLGVPRRRPAMADVVFQATAFMVLVPTLLHLVQSSRHGWFEREVAVADRMDDLARRVEADLEALLARHQAAVGSLAEAAARHGVGPSSALVAVAASTARANPELHNVYVADAFARTVVFHPPLNAEGRPTVGLDFSDRPYIQAMARTHQPVISEVFVGRGGVRTAIVTLGAPVLDDLGMLRGFAVGALDLGRLRGHLHRLRERGDDAIDVTLIDGSGRVVASTVEGVEPLDPAPSHPAGSAQATRAPGLSRVERVVAAGPAMRRNQQALYHRHRPIEALAGWQIELRAPVAPMRAQLFGDAIRTLAVALAFMVVALVAAFGLGRLLGDPLAALAERSARLVDAPDAAPPPVTSSIHEIAGLVGDFDRMAASLRATFGQLEARRAALAREVEDRRQIEAALRREEGRLRVLFHAAPFGVLLADAAGRVIRANPRAGELLGRGAEELVGLAVDGLIGGHGPTRSGEVLPEDCVALRADGARIPVDLACAEIDLPDGPHALWARVDVTEKRKVEAALHEQKRMVAVGQLAAGIAHDFNNLLTAIGGSAELLGLADGLDDEAREDVEVIRRQTERARELVRRILDFGRRAVLDRAPLPVGGTLRHLAGLLSRTLPPGVRVEVEPVDDALTVLAHEGQLMQALTNLALNGVDAMDGVGRLTLSAEAHADQVVLVVADEGGGMDAATAARAFEPFFTTKPPERGTGLGLAQVYGIAQQHGGRARLESTPGVGTRAIIELPRAAALPAPSSTQPLPRVVRRGLRVLVAEDEQPVRRVVERLLTELGHVAQVVPSAERALEALEVGDFDVLVTDVVMPGMGGRALVARLREARPRLPVVVMSGYPLGADDASWAGARGFLTKPFDAEALGRALSSAVSPPAGGSTGAPTST
jgi:two-component system cell cycle sensor histidine kinase/response regulator CckA